MKELLRFTWNLFWIVVGILGLAGLGNDIKTWQDWVKAALDSPQVLSGGLIVLSILMLVAPHVLRLRSSVKTPLNWERAKWKLRQVVGHTGFVLSTMFTIVIIGFVIVGSSADETFYYKPMLLTVVPLALGVSWQFIEALWLDQDTCDKSVKELMDIA